MAICNLFSEPPNIHNAKQLLIEMEKENFLSRSFNFLILCYESFTHLGCFPRANNNIFTLAPVKWGGFKSFQLHLV